jgi:large subunit ribosomal protein L23
MEMRLPLAGRRSSRLDPRPRSPARKVDPNPVTDQDLVRKYTFIVAKDANKLEIKRAIEEIYNAGRKKKEEMITVENVHTSTIKGKKKRVRTKGSPYGVAGYSASRKKAIITLAKGQLLEDYGV